MQAYTRWLFGAAATVNFVVGLVFLFARSWFLGTFGLDAVAGSNIVLGNLVGMFIVLFGYSYLLVAMDAARYRVFIPLGAIGKLCAVACGVVPWVLHEVSATLPALLGIDLVFAVLFFDYLRRTRAS